MITSLRDYIQKKNNQKIVFVVIIGFSLLWSSIAMIQRASSNVSAVAFADGMPISQREYQSAIARVQDYFRQQGQRSMPDIRKFALELVAQEKVMEGAVDKVGVHLSHEYIADKLQDPQFVFMYLRSVLPPQVLDPMGGIKEKELKNFLKATGMSADEFDALLEQTLKQVLLAQLIGGTIYVNNSEIKERYLKEFAQKTFTIYTVSFQDYKEKAKKIALSSDELKKFFDVQTTTYGKYNVPEKRDAKIWTFDPAQYGIALTDKEIQDYYAHSKDVKFIAKSAQITVKRYIFPISEKLAEAQQKAAADKAREALQKNEQSGLPVAVQTTLEIGNSAVDQLLLQAAQDLASDGAFSPVTQTSSGYEVIQRIKYVAAVYKPLEAVEKDVKAALIDQKFRTVFKKEAREAFAQNKFDSFAQAKKAKLETKTNIESDRSPLTQKIFKLGNNGRDVYIEQNKGIALQVAKITPGYTPDFDTIKKQVEEDYYTEKAREALQKDLQKAVQDKNYLKTLKFTEESTGAFNAENSEIVQKLSKKELPVTRMTSMTVPGAMIDALGNNQGFIIELKSIDAQDAVLKEKTPEIRKALEQEAAYLAQGVWFVASLGRSVKIEMNNPTATNQSIDFE